MAEYDPDEHPELLEFSRTDSAYRDGRRIRFAATPPQRHRPPFSTSTYTRERYFFIRPMTEDERREK